MQNEKSKTIAIYNRKMATYLMCCGFILLDTETNPEVEKFKVYIFLDTPQLKEAMSKYKEDKLFHEMVSKLAFKY